MATRKTDEGAQFVRYFGPVLDALRKLGGLAKATAAFCQPGFSHSLNTHSEIGSLRLCAVITADLAAWISSMRKYMSPRLVMRASRPSAVSLRAQWWALELGLTRPAGASRSCQTLASHNQ